MGLALLAGVARAQDAGLVVEHGVFRVHLLMHDIGSEEYSVRALADGRRVLTTTTNANDRGMKRTSVSTLEFGALSVPTHLHQKTISNPSDLGSEADVSGLSATVRESETSRTFPKPRVAFVGFGSMPAAVEMIMLRYWGAHGRPRKLPVVRASAEALPLEIRVVGHEAFQIRGRMVRLTRLTVANLVFGREIVWMNENGRLAAVMTFAGGLPQEEVLDEYDAALGNLMHSGVRQQMLDLAELAARVPVEAQGAYAIVGARLVDGTGAPAVEHTVVVVRAGRIASVGTGSAPAGMRVVHAEGKTLLPGLWEMHAHYSGVEFGPALLAAGVTTARDCGGELEFLTTVRREIETKHALGPRLVMAGLIDSGGPLAFGAVDVQTPAEGVRAVDIYADNHFEQIKVYTQIQPEVLKAIAAEAHARGMTVTGHVPAAIDTVHGIQDGMDQINHLQYVTRALLPEGAAPGTPVDVTSERARWVIALLKERGIVVDPTAGWGEMAGHAKSIDVASFEPGINAAPYTLAGKFRAIGVPAADEAKFRERMATSRTVIRALHEAGVPIVAGSDTGLVGYGLDRELELYVEAGMTPVEAIQTATLGAARAMKLEADSGTVEVGKRADLVLVDGNPAEHISDIRRVVSVVTAGRMYDSRKMGLSVGFNR